MSPIIKCMKCKAGLLRILNQNTGKIDYYCPNCKRTLKL